jgi:DNA-binding transcriptional MerR regulator/effector-binding domain-containing protein
MYTIGEFAAAGRVSVRMLRHYDRIGLLAPAYVDPRTGYRHYDDAQLVTLLRIVELRRLGCSLDDAAEVVGASDHVAALRAVLERRRRQLRTSIQIERAQLSAVESRLRSTEGDSMHTAEIEYRRIDPIVVYAASARAPGMGPENVTPVVDALLGPLQTALDAGGAAYEEPGVFWYEAIPDSDEQRVHVSWVASGPPIDGKGWDVVELPAIDRAAATLYRGAMSGIGDAWHAFTVQVAAEGGHIAGPCREIYLQSEGPQETWVTELVLPLTGH